MRFDFSEVFKEKPWQNVSMQHIQFSIFNRVGYSIRRTCYQ